MSSQSPPRIVDHRARPAQPGGAAPGERALALDAGLGQNAAYMTDLEEELAYRVQLFEVAAVTEIATLRGELGGLQVG